MQTIKLGNSDVSALCLGILQMGTRVDKETSYAILDSYFELGGRFIDTANNYSKWHAGGVGTESETMLGQWMADRGNRDELYIATKVGFNRDDIGPSLSAKTIASEASGSLKRLQTDRVDLYYAHADIRDDRLEETLGAFNELVVGGKALSLGCSNYLAWRIEKARGISRNNGWAEYCCVQQRFTYLRPTPGASFAPQISGNDDLLDYCRENGDFRMLAYSPLLTGAYGDRSKKIASQYLGADAEARLKAIDQVASAHGATPNQVVYAWLLGGSPAIIPLTAPTTTAQLEENLGALKLGLSNDEIQMLTDAGNPV